MNRLTKLTKATHFKLLKKDSLYIKLITKNSLITETLLLCFFLFVRYENSIKYIKYYFLVLYSLSFYSLCF